MKATEAKLLDFLKKSPQFEIPIYQRTYSWTEKECRQLWEDILRAGRPAQQSIRDRPHIYAMRVIRQLEIPKIALPFATAADLYVRRSASGSPRVR
jgi:Protein of unknown function DUF262